MNVRKKIGACLSALALSLGLAATSIVGTPAAVADHGGAHADLDYDYDGDGIHERFESTGWWNVSDGGSEFDQWAYDNFPIKCNSNEATPTAAYQAIVVTDGPWAQDYFNANKDRLREAFRAASSVFTASAKVVLTNQSALSNSLSPRWLTWQQSNGICQVEFKLEPVSATIINNSGDLITELKSRGYNKPNRKYHIAAIGSNVNQEGGISYSPDGSYYDPTPSNQANSTSHSITWVAQDSHSQYYWDQMHVRSIAHELVHDMGALMIGSPNRYNGSHASDCYDLMCYSPAADELKGQTYANGCDSGSTVIAYANSKKAMRLDCNNNDYWAPGAGVWATNLWTIDKSAYLWGGGAQPSTFPSFAGTPNPTE